MKIKNKDIFKETKIGDFATGKPALNENDPGGEGRRCRKELGDTKMVNLVVILNECCLYIYLKKCLRKQFGSFSKC